MYANQWKEVLLTNTCFFQQSDCIVQQERYPSQSATAAVCTRELELAPRALYLESRGVAHPREERKHEAGHSWYLIPKKMRRDIFEEIQFLVTDQIQQVRAGIEIAGPGLHDRP